MRTDRLKIAFVLPGAGSSGGVRAVERLASGLLARGHSVKILYGQPPALSMARLRGLYVRLRHGSRQDWLRHYPGTVQGFTRLTPQVAGRNDIIIGVGVSCVLAIADLPPECGIKVHNSHGVEPWLGPQMDKAWQLPMPRLVVTSLLQRQMRDRGSRDPIFVIPNGVDPAEYYPAVPPEQRTGVGTIFHTTSAKNPQAIHTILWELHRRRPQLPLYLFGIARPAQFPPTASYVRLPSVEAARLQYSRSKVWFCASRQEGFGLPLLEAMASGCAVVSSDCGGPAEIIEDGRNGFLVPVDDTKAQVDRIVQLLDDEPLRRSIVDRARQTVERFAWPRAVETLEKALQQIVADQPQAQRTTVGPLA